jgi:hypothetical protein
VCRLFDLGQRVWLWRVGELGFTQVGAQLEGFAAEVFVGLPRSDQRGTGLRYLRGLMLDGARESM